MYDKKHFLIVLIVTLVGLMIPGSLFASEAGSVRATSSFEGHGLAFALEDERVYMVGAWGGVMTIEDQKGALDATALVCPGTLLANLKTGMRLGEGRCIITNQDGDKVFARWSCTGEQTTCNGSFVITAGTGKYTGITGKGNMNTRVIARGLVLGLGESKEVYGQVSTGVAVWPELYYSIP